MVLLRYETQRLWTTAAKSTADACQSVDSKLEMRTCLSGLFLTGGVENETSHNSKRNKNRNTDHQVRFSCVRFRSRRPPYICLSIDALAPASLQAGSLSPRSYCHFSRDPFASYDTLPPFVVTDGEFQQHRC